MLYNLKKKKKRVKNMFELFNKKIFLLVFFLLPLSDLALVGLHQQMEMRSIKE